MSATTPAKSIIEMTHEEVRDLNAKLGKRFVIQTIANAAVTVVAVVGTILVCNKLENDNDENEQND